MTEPNDPPQARPCRRLRIAWLVAILLSLFHGWMAGSVSSRLGPTADEIAYLTAGYSYWTTGDYRLHPENGQLAQRLIALPLLRLGLDFPPLSGEAGQRADVWAVGRDFFFHRGNDLPAMLAASRAVVALLGAILALLIFDWARRVFGLAGGFVSLVLAVFCPDLLANAGLATSDIASALGFLVATAAWWRLCHRVTIGRILAAGAAAGLLAVAKFSAPLFLPIAVLSALLRLGKRAPLPVILPGIRRRVRGFGRLGAIALGGIAAAGLAVVIVWAAYGFRYSATPDGSVAVFNKPWDDVLIEKPDGTPNPHAGNSIMADGKQTPGEFVLKPGIVEHFVGWARGHRLLPEAYLYGLAFTDRHAHGRLAYFAGDYRETGWPEFFPVAALLKTTLPALLLLVLALALFRRLPQARRLAYRLAPLLAVAIVYGAFSVASHLNIGHRHIIPLYPIAYIAAGVLGLVAFQAQSRRWVAPVLALGLAWHAGESLWVRPHYVTYFNELAGGPAGGHRFFVDSSLDWGQGLPDLKAWLDRNAAGKKLFLSYFGSDDPLRVGITATRVGDFYFDFSARPLLPELSDGVYCISATMLHRVYTGVRGGWTDSYEAAYRRLNDWLAADSARPAGAEHKDEKGQVLSHTEYEYRVQDLEQLRFGRLCHYLESRQPEALVANSIFIYRLTANEIFLALQGPVAPSNRQ